MMENIAIKVENLTKIYRLYDKPQDRLKEALNPFKKSYHHKFYALNNVSFEIKKGDAVGIIGKNGAGKSTLLKIITGVLTPTNGSIKVNGKIASLLELGAGFNPEMTGLENVYLNGTLMGFTREEMENKIDTILKFADIGEFIYQPVKTYSSGMFARLAFATAINVEPDILIVDEALSVGDMAFQMKCLRKMIELKEYNTTILFVTHDIGMLNKFCTRGILLNNAEIIADSTVEDVEKQYRNLFYTVEINNVDETNIMEGTSSAQTNIVFKNISTELESIGDKKALVVGLAVNNNFENIHNFIPSKLTTISINIICCEDIYNPIIGFTIKDRLNNTVFQTNTFDINYELPILKANKEYTVQFTFIMPPLNSGKYSINPAVASGTQQSHIIHHFVYDAMFLDCKTKNYNNLEGYLYINDISVTINEKA